MSAAQEQPAAISVRGLRWKKRHQEKIVALTAYDASFGALLDANGVDLVLVGDSLGNVIQGHGTTLPVTLEQTIYHCAAVARGVRRALIAVDMPFATYPDPATAYRNAARLLAEGHAAMVKLEGAGPVLEAIRYLTDRDMTVCAHLGLTPQSFHKTGYRVQGRDDAAAAKLRADALAVQAAGASALVLEMVPAPLATEISQALEIPTIGIGAGNGCDGQILVSYDMLAITPGKRPKFSRDFLSGKPSIAAAIRAYADAVRDGSFPSLEESF
jgi:3-methyl-2-oxobutanoate hydroxymethyltransferase